MIEGRRATADLVDQFMRQSGADEAQRMLAFLLFDARDKELSGGFVVEDVEKPEFCRNKLPCMTKLDCIQLNRLIDVGAACQPQTRANYMSLVSF
jgi:hypothetical protein